MRELSIESAQEGLRLDKYLQKYMPKAPKSFFYKMLRKKNITRNGKKCDGSERLAEGDVIRLFLSEETIEGFRREAAALSGPVPPWTLCGRTPGPPLSISPRVCSPRRRRRRMSPWWSI